MRTQLFRFFSLGVRKKGVVSREGLLTETTPPGALGAPELTLEKCDLSGHCVQVCPTEAISIQEGELVIDQGLCIYCGDCIRACPHGALIIGRSRPVAQKERKMLEVRYTVR